MKKQVVLIISCLMTLTLCLVSCKASELNPSAISPEAPPNITESPLSEENRILTSLLLSRYNDLLSHKYPDDGYILVSPTSYYDSYYIDRPELIKMEKQRLEYESSRIGYLTQMGYHLRNLINTFFEINQSPAKLTIDSSPQDGLLIDYTGIFDGYFEDGGGGLVKLFAEHPEIYEYMKISRPAYDRDYGAVLAYYTCWYRNGDRSTWISRGFVVYDYKDGKLTEIEDLMGMLIP